MTKRLLIFLLGFFLCKNALSQLSVGAQLAPGAMYLRGNAALASFSKPTFGYAAVAQIQYSFKTNLALVLAPGFEQKGASFEVPLLDALGNVLGHVVLREQLNYVISPLLLRTYLGKQRHLYLNVGAYYGRLLSAKLVDLRATSTLPTVTQTQNFLAADYGACLGFGICYPITNQLNFSSELRHNLGIRNISALPIVSDGKIQTASFNLFFGVMYSFKIRTSTFDLADLNG